MGLEWYICVVILFVSRTGKVVVELLRAFDRRGILESKHGIKDGGPALNIILAIQKNISKP